MIRTNPDRKSLDFIKARVMFNFISMLRYKCVALRRVSNMFSIKVIIFDVKVLYKLYLCL